MTATSAPPRRRRRVSTSPAPTTVDNDPVARKMAEVYAAKVAADDAAKRHTEMMGELEDLMVKEKVSKREIEADGDRPPLIADFASSTVTTLHKDKLLKLVKMDEFVEHATITLANAKKILSGNDFDDVTSTSKSAARLRLRAKGRK